MPKTQVSCPNCRRPVAADITQLFDASQDPQAKNALLSGAYNLIQCPTCGYQGNIPTPIVYHDAEKDLLLTFVPPEMGLPRNEQERLIGALINQVIKTLPQEKRKGYLLNPQTTLTMQGLVERILEGDGITREMLQAQQQRMSLLQRLANITDPDTLAQVAGQEDALLDSDFFTLLSRVMEMSLMGGDRESAQRLDELQRALLPVTTYGRQVQAQSQEIELAINDLRALGQALDHDKLLDLVVNAPNPTRLTALVSLARPGMDYTFFQKLSERIEAAGDEAEGKRLSELRANLLQMTQEIDLRLEAHRKQMRQAIEAIAQQKDIPAAMSQVLGQIDDTFVQELQTMLDEARQQGDLEKSGRYGQMLQVLQQASAPPEMGLVEAYLEAQDEAGRQAFLEQHDEEITSEFVELLANIAMQMQQAEDKDFAAHIQAANMQALRYNMARGLRA